MKKLIPLIIALVTMLGATAQSHRFADTTAQWSLLTYYLDPEAYVTTPYTVTGDTLINAILYQKINNDVFIRKDSTEKVYSLLNDSCEELIYDFGLSFGDTLYINYCDQSPQVFVSVNNVDSIYIGRMRKVISLTYTSPYWGFQENGVWVEGIGTLYGIPFSPAQTYKYIDGPGHRLLCYKENGVVLYHDSINLFPYAIDSQSYMNACDRSEFIFLGISDILKLSHIIYPNPSSSSITITLSQQPQPGTVMHIYNAIGALVKQEDLTTSTQQINVAELADAIYTYAITQQGVRQASGKLVVSH